MNVQYKYKFTGAHGKHGVLRPSPVDWNVLIQVSSQETQRSVIEVDRELVGRGNLDGGLHVLSKLLIALKNKLVLSGSKGGNEASEHNQKLEHIEYQSVEER